MLIRLGNKNRVTNLLFNSYNCSSDDLSSFNYPTLLKVLKYSFGKEISKDELKISIEDEFSSNGQFIIVEDDFIKKYIMFSREIYDTRNGYIISKLPVSYREYTKDDSTNKAYEICLLDVDQETYDDYKSGNDTYPTELLNIDNLNTMGVINSYSIFTYKLVKTLGAKIINEEFLPFDHYINNSPPDIRSQYLNAKYEASKPFASVSEIRKARLKLSSRNTGNKSSYLLETSDRNFVYGKTFGNNGFETVPIALCVAKLGEEENKETVFYQIKDNLGVDGTINKEAKPISKENIEVLESHGIVVFDELRDYTENPENTEDELYNKNIRNQLIFMKNLMIKYGVQGHEDEKKCYICGNDIQETIIASHIQRVCDIKNLDIPWTEKRAKATDGENGLWLCETHDKLFEVGLLSFDEETGSLVLDSSRLRPEQKNFIDTITEKRLIEDEHFTSSLKDYLTFHNQRLRRDYPRISF